MDYNVLRKVIASCVEGSQRDPRFRLNTFKLRKKVKEFGLIPLIYKSSYESKMVDGDDIPLLMEYYKGDTIQWFDSRRSFLTISFVREQDMDDELADELEALHESWKDKESVVYSNRPGSKNITSRPMNDMECPTRSGLDVPYQLGLIVGCYPVYTALVSKCIKPDTISLKIRIRANSILMEAINQSTEPYDHLDDQSGVDEDENKETDDESGDSGSTDSGDTDDSSSDTDAGTEDGTDDSQGSSEDADEEDGETGNEDGSGDDGSEDGGSDDGDSEDDSGDVEGDSDEDWSWDSFDSIEDESY